MTHSDTAISGGPHFGRWGCRCTCPQCDLPDVFDSCICPYETPDMGCSIHAGPEVERPPLPTLREAAEKVVAEIKADMDPDKDSECNFEPYPDPVGALIAFAELIRSGAS